MNIALFSRSSDEAGLQFIKDTISSLHQQNDKVWLFEGMIDFMSEENSVSLSGYIHNKKELIEHNIDFIFSIGGDGTFIDAANIVADSAVPILGINTGRIGFLTNIAPNNFNHAYQCIKEHRYQIEERSLLHIERKDQQDLPTHFALNDISFHPYTEDSINAIHVWANGEKVNTYWGDGLIISTATGSTAYSLSCGGPILFPTADAIVLTPIASHSLTVRPLVLPNNCELEIKVESRKKQFILSMDSQRIVLQDHISLVITRETFTIQTIRLPESNFYSVIREKLLWGMDKRNHLER
jgi:NAD+ kinase